MKQEQNKRKSELICYEEEIQSKPEDDSADENKRRRLEEDEYVCCMHEVNDELCTVHFLKCNGNEETLKRWKEIYGALDDVNTTTHFSINDHFKESVVDAFLKIYDQFPDTVRNYIDCEKHDLVNPPPELLKNLSNEKIIDLWEIGRIEDEIFDLMWTAVDDQCNPIYKFSYEEI